MTELDFAELADARIAGDRILTFLAAGNVRIGLDSWVPSILDLTAAAVARSVVGPHASVGIAVPRGQCRIAFTIGLHLALGRLPGEGRDSYLPFTGSVSLATLDLELRNLARSLRAAGTAISEAIEVHRLGPTGKYVELHSGRKGALDRRQRFLLLHLPHLRPRLAPGVVSISVLDTYSMRSSGWEASFEWNKGDRRRQVWVGELGNAAFEDFCSSHAIPLVSFDWQIIEALVRDDRSRCGHGRLSSSNLCMRAGDPPRILLRPVLDGEANDLLSELEAHFASYHRKAMRLRDLGFEEPGVVITARRLFYFLGRSVAPLHVYEPLALDYPKTFRPKRAMQRVQDATPGEFVGKWERLLTEWSAIRHCLSALYERVRADHPKFWDLYLLLEREQQREPRRRVVLRCASRFEARALELALVDSGVVDVTDLAPDGFLSVSWFGVRCAPLEYGPSWASTLTVLFEPPPPYQGGEYLSAEEGEVEALLYPVECQRFERLCHRTAAGPRRLERTLDTLARLGWADEGCTCPSSAVAPELAHVEAFEVPGRSPTNTGEPDESVDRMQDHWDEYLRLGEIESPPLEEDGGSVANGDQPAVSHSAHYEAARLMRFDSGDYAYFPCDGTVDLYVEERLLARPVMAVRAGQLIVFMEGSERGSALTELFEHFDDQYGPAKVYGELWRRALRSALSATGSDADLAASLTPPLTEQAVRNWRMGSVLAPQDEGHFNQVIQLSGDEVAQRNRRQIRRYVERVRGAHRLLGRVFNRAIGEQLWEPDGPEQRRLEQMLGEVDLTELFSSVELRTIDWAAPRSWPVPRSLLGSTLTGVHPEVREHIP